MYDEYFAKDRVEQIRQNEYFVHEAWIRNAYEVLLKNPEENKPIQ
jgi:hypothetical protein